MEKSQNTRRIVEGVSNLTPVSLSPNGAIQEGEMHVDRHANELVLTEEDNAEDVEQVEQHIPSVPQVTRSTREYRLSTSYSDQITVC